MWVTLQFKRASRLGEITMPKDPVFPVLPYLSLHYTDLC